jgi:ProP effector
MNESLHPVTQEVNRHQIEQSNKARIDALAWLSETFPEAFNTEKRVRPLKKGIMEDIFAYLEEHPSALPSKSKLREAVVMFTRRMEYLVCLKCRNDRIDLQGNFSEGVTEEEATFATNKIQEHIRRSMTQYDSDSSFKSRTKSAKPQEKVNDDVKSKHHSAQSTLSAASSSSGLSVGNKTQVTIKRKVPKRIDPEAMLKLQAKLKAKLDLNQETA